MAQNEMFDSAVRSAGDLAGVFEYDGDTGFLYLYDTKSNGGQKVIAAIQVLAGTPGFDEGDLTIHWDPTESKVGLFIQRQLWAAFDGSTGAKYGGNYRPGAQAEIPPQISDALESL